jgi:hypothetical protein
MVNMSVLDDLSTFEYIENMMMFQVWVWYMELEWIVWLYDVVGNFVDYGCIVNDWDFEWVIKLGTWCIACLTAPHGYLCA